MGNATVASPPAQKTFIAGEWVESASAKNLTVFDPSTEQVLAEVPACGEEDVDRAVAAARTAFETWSQTTAQERGRLLFRLAETTRKHLDTLAELESRNSGKPIVEAEFDVNDVATCFEYYGGLATKITGHVNPVPDNAMSLSMKEPVGVAGQIVDEVLPDRHRVAATPQRVGNQLPVRLAGTRTRRAAGPRHGGEVGGHPGVVAGFARSESVDTSAEMAGFAAGSVDTPGVVAGFGGHTRGRPPRPRTGIPAAFR